MFRRRDGYSYLEGADDVGALISSDDGLDFSSPRAADDTSAAVTGIASTQLASGSVIVEAAGATSLIRVGSNFFLYPKGGASGPELSYQGSPVATGQFGAWTPVGAEAISGGYRIAFQNGSANQFVFWTTDTNGAYLATSSTVLAGSSATLEFLEGAMAQDLNGDGVVGLNFPRAVIEATGGTTLFTSGGAYFLGPSAVGAPWGELTYQGSPVTPGQFGAWTPVAAEIWAGGYRVAFQNGAASQFIFWQTDASGNYLSTSSGLLSGSSATLEFLETTVALDLNGDGVTGFNLPWTMIESAGATELALIGSNYFLLPTAGGAIGAELSYLGAPVTLGQFSGWTPVGAEATSSGYQIVWKNGGADQYITWNTDWTGNFIATTSLVMSATGFSLQFLESSYSQDINGDGIIGPRYPLNPVETSGGTSLFTYGNTYQFFGPGSAAPELMFQGAPVLIGQFGAWRPVAAEAVGGGYQVVWKNGGADQYVIWNVDAAANYTSTWTATLSGSSATLQFLEYAFQQDINGDGVWGFNQQQTTIESAGSTRLFQVGSNYFMTTGSTTVELGYNGAPVSVGQFGAWTPIGAEAASGGYQIIWKSAGANAYITWSANANGDYTTTTSGVMSGTSAALENLEGVYHQDLNNDGVIGVPAHSSFTINPIWDSSVLNSPFRAQIQQAANAAIQFFESTIFDPVTLNIAFGWGEVAGSTISGAVGESSSFGNIISESTFESLLAADASSNDDLASQAAIGRNVSSSFLSSSRFWLTTADAKALNYSPDYGSGVDGSVGLNSGFTYSFDPNNRAVGGAFDAVGVLEHEISEIMGRVGYLGTSRIWQNGLYGPMDLFRYTGANQFAPSSGPGYFSVDGQTLLTQFNNPFTAGGDVADWAPGVSGDAAGYASLGTQLTFSNVDLSAMDVIGWNRS